MLDAAMRRLIDPPLARAAEVFVRLGISANQITWTGFAVGMLVVPLLATGHNGWAAAAIALNRVADGLDGAVARRTRMTDAGGFIDIVLDFIFYSAVPFGLALSAPGAWGLPAAFLIYSFIGTGASFLAYAAVAARRGQTTQAQGRKTIFYLGGLTEGTETIAVLFAICLFPGAFPAFAFGFGALCWITTASRVAAGLRDFKDA